MPNDLLTQSRPEVETEELHHLRTKFLPPYRVVLFNDDYNDMDYVVLALLHTINNLSRQEATRIGLTLSLPIAKGYSLKLAWSDTIATRLSGSGFTTYMATLQITWFDP